MRVMVCAPTGAAASNMSWYTLNAAFLLTVNVKRSDDYIPLSGERLAALKETIGNIKVLIINEILWLVQLCYLQCIADCVMSWETINHLE